MKKLGGDWAVALTVVACSLVLFLALAFALQGNPFNRPSRTLRVQFTDVTGIQTSSLVKYAGAPAGTVSAVRMLTPEERAASATPANIVEITLALNNNVPSLSTGLVASVASDTLLSDKFVLLSGGDPKAPALPNGALIASLSPVTFDALLRDLGGVLVRLRTIFGAGEGNDLEGLLPKVDALLAQISRTVSSADGLITNGNGLIANANGLVDNGDGLIRNADAFVASGRELIDTSREPVKQLLADLNQAADTLDEVARRANKLIKDNESNLNSSARDAAAAIAELKAAAVSTRAFVDSLRARPQQLIWGPGRSPRSSPDSRN